MGTSCSLLDRNNDKLSNDNIQTQIYKTTRTISSRVPFNVRCVVIYNKFYNEVIHKRIISHLTSMEDYKIDWSIVVGSYIEKTCVNGSDVDMIRVIGHVYVNPDDIPKEMMTGLLVITTDTRIPAGTCWLRVYNTTKFDRLSDISRVRNGLEWSLNCSYDGIKNGSNVCHSKEIDGHTHIPYKSVFEKPVCFSPACIANEDGYRYFSRKKVDDYFSRSGLTVFESFNKLLPNWLKHGPAFQQTYLGLFYVDVVNTFHCPQGWPHSAREWKTRPRNWPKRGLVSDIVTAGFHVVPIESKVPGTKEPDLEWRISFRSAETKLVLSFSECQRLCYIILKIIVKEFIQPKFPDEDFMSSYIMKTIMFWVLEETDANMWTENNLIACLDVCLALLKKWLVSGFCPNYFIRDYNLFRTKIQRMFVVGFREWLISEIEENGWKILLQCESFKQLRTESYFG